MTNRIWYSIILFFGILSLGLSSFFLYERIMLVNNSFNIKGRVVELIEDSDDDGTVYYPKIEYQNYQNEKVSFVSYLGSNPPSYEIGEVVPLIASKENKNEVYLDSFWSLYGLYTMFFISGLILIAVGGFNLKNN